MEREKGRFTKGVSGNPTGKRKLKWLTDALHLELSQDPKRARTIALKIIELAEEGDLQAANIIFDRLEGKPTQQVEVSATVSRAEPEEIDARIEELSRRLGVRVALPILDLTAEDADDSGSPN